MIKQLLYRDFLNTKFKQTQKNTDFFYYFKEISKKFSSYANFLTYLEIFKCFL